MGDGGSAVTFLLENLKNLLDHDVHLISGAENQLDQLKNELGLMKAYLKDLAKKREKGELFREFETQIMEVVYEAEDIIDTGVTQAAAADKSKLLLRALNPARISLSKEVKNLREHKVKPIIDRIDKMMINFDNLQIPRASDTSADTSSKDKTKKPPLLRQDNVVGFEDEANTLIKYLKEESKELEVISIIGMPGLGKTTLARKIYHDRRIQDEFPTLIWVYVSQEFNMRDVFLTILKKFYQQNMSSKTDDELVQLVRSSLEKAKFLLFIDDLWTADAWNYIQDALPKSNSSGKVLITSRHENVARHANINGLSHKLRFLDLKESWELFQLEVFGKLDECPSELEVVGKEIANECGGLPLAIVVIGGILVTKFSSSEMKNEWTKVATSMTSHLHADNYKRMDYLISLSYNKLPDDLRDCFLYLGMFPEDFEIPAWKLIRLWIAEGFIQTDPGRSLEEVAEDNLKDLIDRNLVMVDKMKAEGGVKTCRVHDMIREFCKHEAATARQYLFQEMKQSKEGVFYPPVSEIQKSRRLCIHSSVLDFLLKKPKGPLVRSFLCFSKEAITLPLDTNSSIADAFSLLRVLDANPIKFNGFPTKLKQLLHLRYIALSCDDFKALPEAISKLWNIQTIKVDTTSPTFEINDMWKMKKLRHFKTKAAVILSKAGKDDYGENLQTLSRLSAECCTPDVFNRARNLKTLGIRGKLATVFEANCLEKLDFLEKLKLVYDAFPDAASQKPLLSLPRNNRIFPPKLRILTISATFLDWTHMSTLGMIDSLEVLKLKDEAFMGKSWDAVGGGFRSLEFLHIARTDLVLWTSSNDAFPKLRCLELKECTELQEIPFGLVESLQILDIERVTKSAVTSARKIEQEKQRMQGQQRSKRGGFKLLIAPGDAS